MSVAPLLVSFALAASGTASRAPARVPARPKEAKAPAAKSASIMGVVTFKGPVPQAATQDRSSDPACGANTPDEAVSVKDGKLANVLVRVGDAPRPSTPPPAPAIIDQQACTYRPRVVGAQDGQKVLIRNADGTLHNVHTYLEKRSASGKPLTGFNKAQPPGSPPISETFKAAGGVLSVKCDIHPWMQSWVVPVENGFFAITGEDGAFAIDGLEPGTYTLTAWHESYGTRQETVTVPAKGGVRVPIAFGEK